MDEQQQLIKDTLDRLLTDLCTSEVVAKSEEGEFASEVWQSLAETGLTTASIASESGGSGGGASDSLFVIREAARYAAPVPLSEHFIAALLLSDHGASISNNAITVASGDFNLDGNNRLTGTARNVAFARWCAQVVLVASSPTGLKLCRINLAYAQIEHQSNIAGEPRDTVLFDTMLNAEDIFETEALINEKLQLLGAATRCMMMAGASNLFLR